MPVLEYIKYTSQIKALEKIDKKDLNKWFLFAQDKDPEEGKKRFLE